MLLLLRNLFGGSSRQKTRIEFFAREKKSDQPQALAPLFSARKLKRGKKENPSSQVRLQRLWDHPGLRHDYGRRVYTHTHTHTHMVLDPLITRSSRPLRLRRSRICLSVPGSGYGRPSLGTGKQSATSRESISPTFPNAVQV